MTVIVGPFSESFGTAVLRVDERDGAVAPDLPEEAADSDEEDLDRVVTMVKTTELKMRGEAKTNPIEGNFDPVPFCYDQTSSSRCLTERTRKERRRTSPTRTLDIFLETPPRTEATQNGLSVRQ